MSVHTWYCRNCEAETGHEVREKAHHDPAIRALTAPPQDERFAEASECTCTVCGQVEWVDASDILKLGVHDFGD
ncbi:hypothetical protein [Enterovibrio calviensis]|uniref:hypothetical protein n=1 Tax=Enterovibrio calviensis TaxID=91359 RepID=UPI000486849F|nr:hypothetical protein [Enterovibrio calviensis]